MKDQLMLDLRLLFKRYSTWVVAIITIAAGWWLQQPPEVQAAFLANYPAIREWGPTVSLIAYVLAKLAPQACIDRHERAPAPPEAPIEPPEER